jgi:hypothetical protein
MRSSSSRGRSLRLALRRLAPAEPLGPACGRRAGEEEAARVHGVKRAWMCRRQRGYAGEVEGARLDSGVLLSAALRPPAVAAAQLTQAHLLRLRACGLRDLRLEQ